MPRSVQQSIPIDRIYADGVWQSGNVFSRMWQISDINYAMQSDAAKQNILTQLGTLYAGIPADCWMQVCIVSQRMDEKAFAHDVLYHRENDGYDALRAERNRLIKASARENGNVVQHAERAFRFVPACAARLQFAAHPFPRSAPLLRQLAFGKQCSDEADSRVAGSQRLLYHSEYLFASGLLVKGFFGRSHAERPRNGFKSAKWGLNEYDFSPKLSIFSSVFSLLNFSISFSA